MKYYIAPILMAIFGIVGISYSFFRFVGTTSSPVIITPQTVAVYDSLKNVLAYKNEKRWIILKEQDAMLTLEKEIYRLNAIANEMQRVNLRLKKQYDSLTSLNPSKGGKKQ